MVVILLLSQFIEEGLEAQGGIGIVGEDLNRGDCP